MTLVSGPERARALLAAAVLARTQLADRLRRAVSVERGEFTGCLYHDGRRSGAADRRRGLWPDPRTSAWSTSGAVPLSIRRRTSADSSGSHTCGAGGDRRSRAAQPLTAPRPRRGARAARRPAAAA